MTAELDLFSIVSLMMLGLGAAAFAMTRALAEPRRELKPVRVVARRRDLNR